MKKCAICKKLIPSSSFYRNNSRSDGLDVRCISCDHSRDRKRRRGYNLHKECLFKLGGKCNKCGINDIRVLQIDHVRGGGKREMIVLFKKSWRRYYRHVLEDTKGNYQILCANCNWIKKSENKEGVR